jgi:hypothetical protein
MFFERSSKMKKILMGVLLGGFSYLAAADTAVWEHDLDAGTSKRTVGDVVTNFKIMRERSADPVEALPDAAAADTWYQIVRRGTLNLKADGDTEVVSDLAFEQLVCELKITIVDGARSIHGHYGEAYDKVSQWKKKIFYRCWRCEGTQLLARLLRRAAGSAEETVVSESVVGMRHDRKGYLEKDFTNPESQDYEAGKLTPAPDGVGGVNRQAFENTLKAFGKKLGF